jgi:hypothetical protein
MGPEIPVYYTWDRMIFFESTVISRKINIKTGCKSQLGWK